MARVDTQRSDPVLSVDWAPAYELLLSLGAYVSRRMHPNLEPGPTWVRNVRQLLPADFTAPDLAKHDDECFPLLLVYVCPGERDAAGFIEWLAQLTPGAMYDALCEDLPDNTK